MGFFLKITKKGNVALSHKKMTNNQLRTIDQFRFFQCVGKSLKGCCTPTYFLFLLKTTCLISQKSIWNSCINQVLSITHEIYKSFGDEWEVRAVFLDIPKAFEKVWHQGVILVYPGNLLKIIRLSFK